MKNQALFSSQDKSKKLKCRLLHFLFGNLRLKPLAKNEIISLCNVFTIMDRLWKNSGPADTSTSEIKRLQN